MPPNMNDLFGPLVYEMDIYSFRLPAQGALPHRLMVQIMKDDATKPHFRVATGRFYNAPTREFATIGRVLTSPQAGSEGVQSHVLYVMLQMAVPLRGFDRTRPPPDVRPDSYFVISAPPGFRMLEAVPIVHEGAGLGKVTLSPDGDAASRLNDTIQPAPTGFGTPDLGGWSFLGGEATYKLLDRSLIPAMTSLVMGLRVYPGNTSLPITNTLNLWSVQVFSPGDHNETMVNFTAKFYRTGLGGVPVLGRLQNAGKPSHTLELESQFVKFQTYRFATTGSPECVGKMGKQGDIRSSRCLPSFISAGPCCNSEALIQPVDPMVSRDVPTIQLLSIFFKAVEDVPAGGSIDVEASADDEGPAEQFFYSVYACGYLSIRLMFDSAWTCHLVVGSGGSSLAVLSRYLHGKSSLCTSCNKQLKTHNCRAAICKAQPAQVSLVGLASMTVQGKDVPGAEAKLTSTMEPASRVFDFGEQCGAVDLDDGYYVTGPVPAVHRLPRIVSCTSYRDSGQTAGPYNIARIFVEGPLKGINIYGFSIPVRNPTLEEVSQILSMTDPWSDVDWNLTTRGPEGSPVCATYGGAPGAPDGTGSWRLVNKSIPPKASVSDALATDGPADFEEMLQSFRLSTKEFQEMNKVSDKPSMAATEVKRLEESMEDFQHTLKQFGLDVKEITAKCSAHFTVPGLPMDVRRSWMQTLNESGTLRKEAGESLEKVRAATNEAKALAKKEMLRAAKAKLQLEDDPGEIAVAKARQLLEVVEEKVEPFIGIPKGKDEGEMQWLAKELEPMIESVDEAIDAAKSEVASHPLKMEIEIEEEIKEDIKEYLKDEAKKLQMSLGQFGRRTRRVRNLVANYQKDLQDAKSKELIAELKPQIVEQVKAVNVDDAAAEVTTLIKEAEVLSEKVRLMGSMSLEDLQAAAKEIDAKVAEAADGLEGFQQQICPVEDHITEEVDEKVKQTLRKHILAEFKGLRQKVDFFQNRVKRVKGILDKCHSQIRQKDGLRLKGLRTKVLGLMDVFREDQAGKGLEGLPSKDLFGMLDRDKDGLIGKEEFLSFFDDVAQLLEENQESLRTSTEDLEKLFDFGLTDGQMGLSFEAFERLLIRFVQVVRPTVMTQQLTLPGEAVREVKPNEILEVLAGPQVTAKMKRVYCRSKDGAIGWVTVIGNVGSFFLKDFQPE
eukprot:s689_g14.t3